MPSPLSVLTPVYNGRRFLDRAYRCLCLQTFVDWEWVVVDDGSTDGTFDAAMALADGDERIRVSRHAPNRGRGFSRTRTLENARGEWSVIWDVDDFYHPHRLELVDQARIAGFDFTCGYAHIVDNDLQPKGIRGYFDFLGVKCFVHATLAGRTDLLRSIGYERQINTVGQIGEDHRMGLVLPARHRGCYHERVVMINVEDVEVFLQKAIDSNRVRLQILQELHELHVFPCPSTEVVQAIKKQRRKLMVLKAMQVWPPIYMSTVKHRGYGQVRDGYRVEPADLDFLSKMQSVYGNQSSRLRNWAGAPRSTDSPSPGPAVGVDS